MWACALQRTPRPGAIPARTRAPVAPLLPERRSCAKKAQARGAAGVSWQVQPAAVCAPRMSRVAPVRAVAHLCG